MSNPFLNENPKDFDYVNYQNSIIDDNISYRTQWANDCRSVIESYRGNAFPTIVKTGASLTTTSKLLREKGREVFVNMVKRQYRVMSNYLLNNEPQYLISKTRIDVADWIITEAREFLKHVLEWKQEWSDIDDSFYDSIMDDVIYFGLFRGIAYTLWYYDENKWFLFRSYDPFDCYIDMDARTTKDIRKFIITYTKPKDIIESEYKVDWLGKWIDWKNISSDPESTASNIKETLLVEKPNSNTYLIREWYYLIREGETDSLYRILTTNRLFLEKKKLPLGFMPVEYYTPNNEPEELYPRWWYVDMLTTAMKINDIIAKMSMIIETGGRFVYVKEWTVLKKGTWQLLNSLGIEIIEVSDSQELPQQATLLSITQSDIEFLNLMMTQCENEWGMKQEIMGNSSLGSDASWRAIQALQAGSKNNIGSALNELNKYMTRIVKLLLRLNKVYGGNKFYSEWNKSEIKVTKNMIDKVNIKVDVTARSAFDEVTQEIQAIQMLDYIFKFNPDTKITPKLITQILWTSNEYADDIQAEIDQQIDPDLQISEGENKKLMNAVPLNVNQNDNHQLHLAMHSSLLKSFPPESPAGVTILNHLRQHEAFFQVWEN